jgi:hypothetical protein
MIRVSPRAQNALKNQAAPSETAFATQNVLAIDLLVSDS